MQDFYYKDSPKGPKFKSFQKCNAYYEYYFLYLVQSYLTLKYEEFKHFICILFGTNMLIATIADTINC